MIDDDVIDLRESTFLLTAEERALLQTIVDRNVIDLPSLGRSLGTSDEGVFALLRSIADKLTEFRYLVEGRTPPFGTPRVVDAVAERRRPVLRGGRRQAPGD